MPTLVVGMLYRFPAPYMPTTSVGMAPRPVIFAVVDRYDFSRTIGMGS